MMMTSKISILLFWITLSVHAIKGQSISLDGKVVNQHNKPMEFVEVILETSDHKKISEVVTTKEGLFHFDLERGNYVLRIQQLGETFIERLLEIDQSTDLGVVQVNESFALKEVLIEGRKRLIERKIDRMVFHLENSLSAGGGNAIDALDSTPGLHIENNQISMIGKSRMHIMLNDRMIHLAGDDLMQFLRNIPSDDIKSIEVIRSPPAKYDAEGNSGLINIITKSVRKDSYNGNMRSSLSQSHYSHTNQGIGYNYNKNRWTFASAMNYRNGRLTPFQRYTLSYPTYLWLEENNKTYYFNSLSGRLAIDYQLNSNVNIGGEYSGSTNQPLIKTTNHSTIYAPNALVDSLIINEARLQLKNNTHSLNFYSVIKRDSLGQKISIDFDYLKYTSSTDNTFENQSFFANGNPKPDHYLSAKNYGNLAIDIYTARLDWEYPTSWAKLNFGTKLSFINNHSDASLYNTTSGTAILDLNNTNAFIYKEKIQALYFSGNKKLLKDLSIRLGIRGENTQTEGLSTTLNTNTKNTYFKFFPTAYLVYELSPIKSFGLTYNRRINRPKYSNLNPFRFYSTPYNYSEGNPFLQPYFIDNIELSYAAKNSYTQFYINAFKNAIDQVTFVNENNHIQQVIPVNTYNQFDIGVFQDYSFRIKRWESNNNASFFYRKITAKIPELENQSLWSGSFKSTQVVAFDKNNRYRTQLSYTYRLPSLAGSYRVTSISQLNIGFRTHFFNQKLSLNIEAIDVLKSAQRTFTQTVNRIKQENYDYADVQRINFALTYAFGKKLNLHQHKNVNREEKQRLN